MPRILVLEDNSYLRMLYALRLAAHGHVVVAAPDSPDGLKQVQASDLDLIVKNPHSHRQNAGQPQPNSIQGEAVIRTNPKNSSGRLSEVLQAKPKAAKAAALKKLAQAPAATNCVSSV